MYLSIANHLGLHISEPIYKTLVGPSTCNPRSASVNGCSVLRGAQSVGFGPHLSHLIYIYKSKIIKYMYTVTEKLLYTIKGPMKVIHIFTKAHILLCLPCSRYTLVFFLVWLVGPLNSWAPGAAPAYPPLSRPEIGQIHLML